MSHVTCDMYNVLLAWLNWSWWRILTFCQNSGNPTIKSVLDSLNSLSWSISYFFLYNLRLLTSGKSDDQLKRFDLSFREYQELFFFQKTFQPQIWKWSIQLSIKTETNYNTNCLFNRTDWNWELCHRLHNQPNYWSMCLKRKESLLQSKRQLSMHMILASINHWNDEESDAIFSSRVLIYSKKVALELADFDDREIFRAFGEIDFCWKTDLHKI